MAYTAVTTSVNGKLSVIWGKIGTLFSNFLNYDVNAPLLSVVDRHVGWPSEADDEVEFAVEKPSQLARRLDGRCGLPKHGRTPRNADR